ncbi:MAG: L-rhamnose/proton symporter RhaT [Terriglobia bacterium]|jgi:L-rhamnose-H+ transport protein
MTSALNLGLLLVILGGLMEGSFCLPLKYAPKWAWENTWGACSLLALILVPWPLAILTVPHLLEVYSASSPKAVISALLFGAGWGAGGLFLGLALDALGLSLGISLVMGLIAIGGSIIPLLMQRPDQLTKPAGIALQLGIMVMIAGLFVCAAAGRMKERSCVSLVNSSEVTSRRRTRYGTGILFCFTSGLLSALVNFALIFGAGITDAAIRRGVAPTAANNALWALVFTSNYLVNVSYCVYLATRRKTFGNFIQPGTWFYWVGTLLMGLLWAGGIVVYGLGAMRLGRFGAIFGFPIMLISSIIVGNVLGALTGEWQGTAPRPKLTMASGVLVLVIATGIIAYSNHLIA